MFAPFRGFWLVTMATGYHFDFFDIFKTINRHNFYLDTSHWLESLSKLWRKSPLTDWKKLHPQQFGFRKGHSTEHAIAQLVDQSTNHLRKKTPPLVFLLSCQRRLIQSIIQYFCKSLRSMDLRVQILPGLEVTW